MEQGGSGAGRGWLGTGKGEDGVSGIYWIQTSFPDSVYGSLSQQYLLYQSKQTHQTGRGLLLWKENNVQGDLWGQSLLQAAISPMLVMLHHQVESYGRLGCKVRKVRLCLNKKSNTCIAEKNHINKLKPI